MRLRFDAARCSGHGRCYALCPELFQEDDAGHASLFSADVPARLEGRARAAVENCPESAIALEP